MLKKCISVLLAVCAVCCCCMLPAAAERELGVISVRLNSDVAGCTQESTQALIELLSDNVVYKPDRVHPVSVSDYAGTVEYCPLVAGRTYFVTYMLSAADGYTLPDKLQDGDVQIECGKGVTVYATQITVASIRGEDGTFTYEKSLTIQARVLVDGNIFQRIVGWIYDQYLKLRAWSLY